MPVSEAALFADEHKLPGPLFLGVRNHRHSAVGLLKHTLALVNNGAVKKNAYFGSK